MALGGGNQADPLVQVAARIAEEARLLCFDEFQVTDVADAMILRRLLEALLGRGVTLVATSNRLPRDLYLHGLNRPQFLPAISLLESSCELHAFGADSPDYRLMHLSSKTWMHPLGPSSEKAFEKRWDKITTGRSVEPTRLQVQGREVPVPAASAAACRFDFATLCGAATGAIDYLAVANNFHTVFLDNVPRMTEEDGSQVRRLITVRSPARPSPFGLPSTRSPSVSHPLLAPSLQLTRKSAPPASQFIDILYDKGVRLVARSEADIGEVYQPKTRNEARDEDFAWDRTVSRLTEMQSEEYRQGRWGGGQNFLRRLAKEAPPEAEAARRIWEAYDADNDGDLSERELGNLLADVAAARGEGTAGRPAVSELRSGLDLDADGRVSWDDFRSGYPEATALALRAF